MVGESSALNMEEREKSLISKALYVRCLPSAAMTAGKGAWLTDASGRHFLDFEAGGCVANTGYCHPRVVAAICEQASRLTHNCFALMGNDVTVDLASRLVSLTPGDFEKKVWFGLSGSDANDCVYKLARWHSGRPRLIACIGAYHGQTMGALALSGLRSQSRFITLSDVVKIPYPYCYRCPFGLRHPTCGVHCLTYVCDYLFQTVCDPQDVAAFVIEPIQGDAGTIVPPSEYLTGVADLCREHGILLVVDEVLTGLGRTGKMLAIEHTGVIPDLVVLGKALGSGIPMSAVVGKAEVLDSMVGGHLLTVGGNTIGSAAAIATLDVIHDEDLASAASRIGGMIVRGLREMKKRHRLIGDVRGAGLLVGLEMVDDNDRPAGREAHKVCYAAYKRGLVMIFLGLHGNVLRINPPLVMTAEEAARGLSILDDALSDVECNRISDEEAGVAIGW